MIFNIYEYIHLQFSKYNLMQLWNVIFLFSLMFFITLKNWFKNIKNSLEIKLVMCVKTSLYSIAVEAVLNTNFLQYKSENIYY